MILRQFSVNAACQVAATLLFFVSVGMCLEPSETVLPNNDGLLELVNATTAPAFGHLPALATDAGQDGNRSCCQFNEHQKEMIADQITAYFQNRFVTDIPQLVLKLIANTTVEEGNCIERGANMYFDYFVGSCQYCPLKCAEDDGLCFKMCQAYQANMEQNTSHQKLQDQINDLKLQRERDRQDQEATVNLVHWLIGGLFGMVLVCMVITSVVCYKLYSMVQQKAIMEHDDLAALLGSQSHDGSNNPHAQAQT